MRRRCDADRVREHDLGASGESRCELGDAAGIDGAFERATEADGDRHRRRHVRERENRLRARDRFLERRVPVRAVEALGRREGDVEAVEPRCPKPVIALIVQHEPRILPPLAPLDRRDDLFRARHLRHPVVTHEAHRLDARKPHPRETVDQLGTDAGRERLRLVLETVPRPDVAERYLRHAGSVDAVTSSIGATGVWRRTSPPST